MTIGGPGTSTMDEEDEKPRTLLIGNIPREVHKREIEEIFGEVGPLKRCYIQYPRDDKKKRSGDTNNNSLLCYVTFALPEDAVKALETLGSHKIGGSKIFIKYAKTRSEQFRPPVPQEEKDNVPGAGPGRMDSRRLENDRSRTDDNSRQYKNPNMIPVSGVEPQRPKAKSARPKTINKKSRLIIRNLSFKVTEDKIQEYFGSCGEIKDINILKKPDGKLVGCAFVQFSTVPEAAKAVRELNLKPFLGRPIAIDWALPKKDFQGGTEAQDETKTPNSELSKVEIKSENEDQDVQEIKITAEPEYDESYIKFENPYEMGKQLKIGNESKLNKKRKFKTESSDEEEESNKKPRRTNDVEEGKTLFIRNLDFSVTEEQLKDFFEAYGKLHYALLCKDNLTEHPKGTGFVKFQDLDSANNCLADFNIECSKFKLGNRLFLITLALPRERVESKATSKNGNEKVKHDNRNLYLVREGFIRPGSSAAEGVSVVDMNKRAALNSTKRQMLKNLSIFVSPNRLCVHNLPLKLTDKALRKLFKKYCDTEARITEARIMRNMKDIQLGGKGKSKGYGFVTFSNPDHALAALRTINNNPEIFTPNERPIVEFSLENRKALNAKEKRMEKSQEKNTIQIQKSPGSGPPLKSKKKGNRRNAPNKLNTRKSEDNEIGQSAVPKKAENDEIPISYSGLKGKVGVSKLPVMKPKGKGKITRKSLKGSKSAQKKLQERRMREPQLKPKKSIDKPDKVEKMVNKYKERLEGAPSTSGRKNAKGCKWYQKSQ